MGMYIDAIFLGESFAASVRVSEAYVLWTQWFYRQEFSLRTGVFAVAFSWGRSGEVHPGIWGPSSLPGVEPEPRIWNMEPAVVWQRSPCRGFLSNQTAHPSEIQF